MVEDQQPIVKSITARNGRCIGYMIDDTTAGPVIYVYDLFDKGHRRATEAEKYCRPLTARQRRILIWIAQRSKRRLVGIDDVANHFGFSRVTISKHLKTLVQHDALVRTRQKDATATFAPPVDDFAVRAGALG